MNLLVNLTLILALILSIVVPFVAFSIGKKSQGKYKAALATNLVLFFGIIIFSTLFFAGNSFAAQSAEAAASSATGLAYVAAGLSIGLACIGGGIAVSAAASAALGAISEDPGILGKSLIFVGLAEGVCLYGLIIAFMILGKL